MSHGFGDTPLTDDERRLVEANTGLIWWQINRWRVPEERKDDAFGDGVFGLMRAAQKFDPSYGFKFSTYALWWIKQAIRRGSHVLDRNAERAAASGRDHQPPMSLDLHTTDGLSLIDIVPALDDVEEQADLEDHELYERLLRCCKDDVDRAVVERILDTEPRRVRSVVADTFGVSQQSISYRIQRLRSRAGHPSTRKVAS